MAQEQYENVTDELLNDMSRMQRLHVEQNEKDQLRNKIKTAFEDQMNYLKDNNVRILFCVGPDSGSAYAIIKQVAEIEVGILTQYLKGSTVLNKLNQSTIANILLKVNTKLNGTNHCLAESPILNDSVYKSMFIGADVTHSSPDQRTIPR